MSYLSQYSALYIKHYRTLQNIQSRIDDIEKHILSDPYVNTERLTFKKGFNLKGCRSARV